MEGGGWYSFAAPLPDAHPRLAGPLLLRPLQMPREPLPGDEEVGGAAWPLMDEWRMFELRREVATKLDRSRTREPIMELEIAMIDECGLTLPPLTAQPVGSSVKGRP